jgi:hypothetical protein
MATTIDTPAGKLTIGKKYDLTLAHGTSERVVKKAEVRSFEQDGETRYELTGLHQNHRPDTNKPPEEWEPYEEELTIGFLPENVLKAKAR